MKRLPLPECTKAANTVRRLLGAFVCTVLLSASLTAQPPVSLPTGRITVRQAITELERQTGKVFGYSTHLDLSRTVRIEETATTLDDAVRQVIGDDFVYAQDGNYILIYLKSLEPQPLLQFISGLILDAETGLPAADTFIEILGWNNSRRAADENGTFRFDDLEAGFYVIKISSADGETVMYREIAVWEDRGGEVEVQFRNLAGSLPETVEERYLVVEPAEENYLDFRVEEELLNIRGSYSDYRHYTPSATPFVPVLPALALKTNLAYDAIGVFNLQGEFRLARKWSVDLLAGYSPWKSDTNSRRIWLAQPELRYWFCHAFRKHFVGIYGTFGEYKAGFLDVPMADLEKYYMIGSVTGAGLSYGYHMPVGKRLGLEFTLGVGYMGLNYKRYDDLNATEGEKKVNRYFYGPTKVGISLLYIIR